GGGGVLYAGWDWATETHAVTVLDESGSILEQFTLHHDEQQLREAMDRLNAHASPKQIPVAIQTTTGLVVDRLVRAGHPVVPVHPNAFNATRPRWGASRAKSDPGDSFKLADYLRTDGHRLRRLAPVNHDTEELQVLVRTREDDMAARVAATNQLRALLDRHWPGAIEVFARIDSEIALGFLEDYPTPQAAARLGEARMAMFCRRHSYCGRRPPAELL